MSQDKVQALKKDFRNFLYVIWEHLSLPHPTPVQYEVCTYLQHGPRRMIIEAFRGLGKSWLSSVFVLWLLFNNPQLKILVVSASKTRADEFSTFTLKLIEEVPILRVLKPKENQRHSKVSFDVGPAKNAHAPSVKSLGITSQLTGGRADLIIGDDIESSTNSWSTTMREKLLHSVKEFESVLKPGGRIIFLGTPHSEESIYNNLSELGYVPKIWPARYPAVEDFVKYGGALAETIREAVEKDDSIIGKSTDPKRFTDLDLKEREFSIGRSTFALQFMLDTSLSDADKYPLKLSDLIVMDVNNTKAPISISHGNEAIQELPSVGFTGDRFYRPMHVNKEWADYQYSLMVIDSSGRGADETSYVIAKVLHSIIYIVDFGGFKGGYDDDTLKALALKAKIHKVNQVLLEANYGDGMFTKLFSPVLNLYHPCNIEEVKHYTNKENRIIDTLEPVMNRHKLVVDLGAIKRDIEDTYKANLKDYSLLYQLTRITREKGALKHDDRLDALAMAIAYLSGMLERDIDKEVQKYKDKLMEDELQKFMKAALGTNNIEKDLRASVLGW